MAFGKSSTRNTLHAYPQFFWITLWITRRGGARTNAIAWSASMSGKGKVTLAGSAL